MSGRGDLNFSGPPPRIRVLLPADRRTGGKPTDQAEKVPPRQTLTAKVVQRLTAVDEVTLDGFASLLVL